MQDTGRGDARNKTKWRAMSKFLRFGSAVGLALAVLAAQKAAPVNNGAFPLVSPSAPRILFESNRTGTNQLYLINADGTGERQLTHRPTDVSAGQWLPGGQSIFYSVARGDSSVVYELWPDSARERLLRVYPGRSPQLAPARDFVLYDVGPWTASHLVLADPRGIDPKQVTDNSWVVWRGVWSPNGRQIAYTASNKKGMSIWVMNYDASNPHQVSHLTPQEGRAQMPAWSPDGQRLAFQSNVTSPRGKSTLWILDLRTGAERELLPHSSAYLDETPSWFSNGKRLAFQSNRTGRMEIWAVDDNGLNLRRVTGQR
jgi:TolB protein